MEALDKEAMGKRIRKIRSGRGLRQWELAQMLGTTQSAVHKYEHGVVPEPRRLIELARIGGTSVEWVLTGEHWDSGSTRQERLDAGVLDTACQLREIAEGQRDAIDEALGIFRDAIHALRPSSRAQTPQPDAVDSELRGYGEQTLSVLESAWRIQRAVLQRLTEGAVKRLRHSANAADAADDSTSTES